MNRLGAKRLLSLNSIECYSLTHYEIICGVVVKFTPLMEGKCCLVKTAWTSRQRFVLEGSVNFHRYFSHLNQVIATAEITCFLQQQEQEIIAEDKSMNDKIC